MGPRSIERGNEKRWVIVAATGMLQWGRARLSAEIQQSQPIASRRRDASMGPRSIERGNNV